MLYQMDGNLQEICRESDRKSKVRVNWLFNVTINDISVIYVTAHTCAGGLTYGRIPNAIHIRMVL